MSLKNDPYDMTFDFEKFANDICEREENSRKYAEDMSKGFDRSYVRKHNLKHREKWSNKIVYGR